MLIVAALLVVDDARQQVVGEVALLQFVDLSQHQALHFVKALSLIRRTHQEESTVVAQQFGPTGCTLHLHRLVQVEVEKAGTSVTQHVLHQLQRVCLQLISLLGAPSHPDGLRLLSDDRRVLW